MDGPEPRGFWSAHEAPSHGRRHDLLVAGQRYEVIATRHAYIELPGAVHLMSAGHWAQTMHATLQWLTAA